MQLVLLPGMDGTGELFSPLLPYLKHYQVNIITLPENCDQSYTTLTQYISNKLPVSDYLLVAESFSGPIAAMLASSATVKPLGIVFVASFLTPPNQLLLSITRFIPIKSLATLPLIKYLCYRLLLGKDRNAALQALFDQTIKKIPSNLLKERLKTIRNLNYKEPLQNLPASYIQASEDLLVNASQLRIFKQYFPHIQQHLLPGTHFILQTNPQECAQVIIQMNDRIMKQQSVPLP